MTADVTVVVPTHDRPSLLEQTLRSVLAQRGVEVDVVVVDDASSEPVASHPDPRVRVVRNETTRLAAGARNAGLDLAATPWVAFCDDDDLWAPHKLRAQLDAAAAAPDAGWVACAAVLVDEDLAVLDHQRAGAGGDVLGRVLAGNDIPGGGSGVLARTELVRDAGGFHEGDRNAEDWDLWIRLAARSPLATVDRPLVAYRIWAGSKSRAAERMIAAWERITTRYADLAAERGVVPDPVAHRRYLAKQLLRSGDRAGAVRLFAELGARHGWRGAWARLAVAAVAPGVLVRAGDRRARAGVPAGWADEVRAWLDDLGAARAATPHLAAR